MGKDPYIVLGIREDCTKEEATSAYEELRAKYEDLRFEPGEVGADASARLDELRQAYNDVINDINSRVDTKMDESAEGTGNTYSSSNFSYNLQEAEKALHENRIDDAQRYLDNCNTRNAQWHYLQSAVFYRKNWVSEALKQLNIACDIDPTNVKYKEARDRMEKAYKANTTNKEYSYSDKESAGRSYQNNNFSDNNTGRGCTACDVCTGLLCADCCCECCGGDLIGCC